MGPPRSADDPSLGAVEGDLPTLQSEREKSPGGTTQSKPVRRKSWRSRALAALARKKVEAMRWEEMRQAGLCRVKKRVHEYKRLMRERLEQDRLEQKRLEAERLEQERLEQGRLELRRLEQRRLEQDTMAGNGSAWREPELQSFPSAAAGARHGSLGSRNASLGSLHLGGSPLAAVLQQMNKFRDSMDFKLNQIRDQQQAAQQRDRQWMETQMDELLQHHAKVSQRLSECESKIGRGLAELGGFRAGISDALQDSIRQQESAERRQAEWRHSVEQQLARSRMVSYQAQVDDAARPGDAAGASEPIRHREGSAPGRLAGLESRIRALEQELSASLADVRSGLEELPRVRESILAQISPIVEGLHVDIAAFKQAFAAAEDAGALRKVSLTVPDPAFPVDVKHTCFDTQHPAHACSGGFESRLSACEAALAEHKHGLLSVGDDVAATKRAMSSIALLHGEARASCLDVHAVVQRLEERRQLLAAGVSRQGR